MTGALWATVAGIGFGVFQSLNRRAVADMDAYLSTFFQLLLSTLVLGVVAFTTEDVARLGSAPLGALAAFAIAGFAHFFLGWTLLNVSQKRIGAARTGPLLASTPLFAAAIAAVALGEVPGPITLVGMAVTVAGVYVIFGVSPNEEPVDVAPGDPGPTRGVVATATRRREQSRLAVAAALGTALCWSVSPVFIRWGLEGLPSPLLGVAVSMATCVVAYAVVLVPRRARATLRAIPLSSLGFKVAAGLVVGLATWARWIALDRASVAVVLSLNTVNVPTVMLLAPLLMGRHVERVTGRLWLGATVVIAGALILNLLR